MPEFINTFPHAQRDFTNRQRSYDDWMLPPHHPFHSTTTSPQPNVTSFPSTPTTTSSSSTQTATTSATEHQSDREALERDLRTLKTLEVPAWINNASQYKHSFLLRPKHLQRGRGALHMVADFGTVESVRQLVRKLWCSTANADKSLRDRQEQLRQMVMQTESYDGKTALHWAAKVGNKEVVRILVEILVPTMPLMYCTPEEAELNETLTEEELDKARARLGIKSKYEKWTALHAAAMFGHVEVVKMLLANMNLEDILARDSGITGPPCLYYASERGMDGIVKDVLKEIGIEGRIRQDMQLYRWENLTRLASSLPDDEEEDDRPTSGKTDGRSSRATRPARGEDPIAMIADVIRQRVKHLHAFEDEATPKGMTALHYAAMFDKLEVVKLIVERIPQEALGIRDEYQRRTALQMAIMYESEKTAQYLIGKMRLEELRIAESQMPYYLALELYNEKNPDLSTIREDYKKYQAMVERLGGKEPFLKTALHMAFARRLFETGKMLVGVLEKEDMCEVEQLNGQNVLHIALDNGVDPETLKVLLEKGGQEPLNAPDFEGKTPLFVAIDKLYSEIQKANNSSDDDNDDDENSEPPEPLYFARQCVDILLSHITPKDLLYQDPSGMTILHFAISLGSEDTCTPLFSYISTELLSITDENGRTPLHYCCETGNEINLQRLLTHKLFPPSLLTLKDSSEQTPLQIATVYNNTCIIPQLLEVTPVEVLTTPDATGSTPLHIAVRNVNPQIFTHLFRAIPSTSIEDFSPQDTPGKRTPLHYALMNYTHHAHLASKKVSRSPGDRDVVIANHSLFMISKLLEVVGKEALIKEDVDGNTVLGTALKGKDAVLTGHIVGVLKRLGVLEGGEEEREKVSEAVKKGKLGEFLKGLVRGTI